MINDRIRSMLYEDEVIQPHGAQAANLLGLSTQVPMYPVYHTSGPSREVHVGNLQVKFLQTYDNRKLQHAGTKVGLVISALFYLNTTETTEEIVAKIKEQLTEEEREQLHKSDLPSWMRRKLTL